MGSPIKLDVLANVRGFQAGTDDVADALDDVADSLDELVRDGGRGTDKLERGFADLARDARRSGDDIGDGVGRGFKRAADGADDFKQEANSSLRETAASISDVTDGLDAVQEIAANAFVGFGPVGAGAGLVAALGLGLVTAEIQKQQEEADELKQRFSDAYKAAAEEGRTFLDDAQVQAAALDIIFDTDKRKAAQKDAAAIGIDLSTMTLALAGDQDALNVAIEASTANYEAAAEAVQKTADGLSYTGGKEAERLGVVGAIAEKLRTQKGIQDENKAAAEQALEIDKEIDRKNAETNAAAKAAIEERGRALEEYARRVAAIPNPDLTPNFNDAGLSDLERRVEALNGRNITLRVRGEGMSGGRNLFD